MGYIRPSVEGSTEHGGVSPTREIDPDTRGRIPHTLELYESIGITL